VTASATIQYLNFVYSSHFAGSRSRLSTDQHAPTRKELIQRCTTQEHRDISRARGYRGFVHRNRS
jgi:hypothetical protein